MSKLEAFRTKGGIYFQGNFAVVPRTVTATAQGAEPQPNGLPVPNLHHGAHWVGWVSIHRPNQPDGEHFAVWQDYKRRGFFAWQDGWERPEVVAAGDDLEYLLTCLENFHR